MKNLKKLGLIELNAQEVQEVNGGGPPGLFGITGFLDGIEGNFHGYLFGFRIW